MLKILLLLFGLVAGAAGSSAWLLSEPGEAAAAAAEPSGNTWQDRLQRLQVRFQKALYEGNQAGQQTERRLQRELDAYRKGSRSAS